MSIKIGVDAEFDSGSVKKEIDAINAQFQKLGETVAKASGMSFNPITLQDKADLDYFIKQSEKLMKIQGGMRSQMQKSGQGNKNPLFANWGHMYLNEQTRMKRMQEMLVFYGGEFSPTTPKPPANPPSVPGGGNTPPRNPWVNQGLRVINSGARSFGPMGGVFSNAINDGAAGGFGAGLAGLVGGIAALGIGKLVSGVMNKVGDAQNEAIMSDQLLRRLSGRTSFDALRGGIRFAADDLGISYNEGQTLAAKYARSAGVNDGALIPGELMTSGRWSRGFGLDPDSGVNFFGSMRNMRVTNSDQDMRKLGVLIGETIARSDAFAKSDEVLQAISGYVETQTRLSLTSANVSGYAGTFSALTGSGIPGLDPAGAANMLSRVNSALMSGGARGEASQFLTSRVANRMGLDPLQMAVLKEGGAFATNNQMFGAGSVAGRFGMHAPAGGQTFLSATLDELRQQYRGQNPGLLAMATANHLGIGMNQAMALLQINPNQMGAIQSNLSRLNVDMGTLDAGGIKDISTIAGASGAGLQDIAARMMNRTGKGALTGEEKDRLKQALAGGDQDKLRDLLVVMAAQKGQIETEGSKTRDTIARTGNIMQDYASKSLPLLNDSRAALLFLAGKQGAGGPQALRNWALDAEHQENLKAIEAKYPNVAALAKKMQDHPTAGVLSGSMVGGSDPEGEKIKAQYLEAAKPMIMEITAENKRAQQAKSDADQSVIDNYNAGQAVQQNALDGTSSPVTNETSTGTPSVKKFDGTGQPSSGAAPAVADTDAPNAAAVEQIESGGRMFNNHGGYLTSKKGAMGSMQVMPGTLRDPGFGVVPARSNSPAELKRVGVDYLEAMYDRYGDTDQALAAYNWGPGNMDLAIAKYGQRWRQHLPQETSSYLRKYHALQVDKTDRNGFSAQSAYNVSVSGEGTITLGMDEELRGLVREKRTGFPNMSFPAAKPAGG